MATKLKSYDFSTPSELTMADKAVYPWEEWFDGDIWEIEYEKDFQGHPLMMERIIRTRATGKHARVRMRHVPVNGQPWGKIVLQRTDITGPEETKRATRKQKSAATRAANAKTKATPIKKAAAKANGKPSKRLAKQPAAVA